MRPTIEQILRRGPATSKEIQAATGMSQGTVSRQVRALGGRIIRQKIGRSPHYMLTRNAFGGDDRLPLYMVDPHGNNTAIGFLRPLAHGGFFLEQLPGLPPVLLGESRDGLFPSLPYFLFDLAPQGFIGRQIAVTLAQQSDFPSDPKHWTVDHIGRYLVSNGDDLPGNLKFGAQAHLRLRRKPVSNSPKDYPRLADRALSGTLPGSSVGGEQPKFTAYCEDRGAHVIVKFSPKGDDATATRWRDVLITEFHASEAILAREFPAAETRLFDLEGRLFLESKRFDRSGEHGRLPMISLQSVDAEFTAIGHGWHRVMKSLYDDGLVSWQHLFDATVLWCVGKLIHNTDMHLGNLSLGIDGSIFRLLPVYDMCSMGFAPRSGEVGPYDFDCPALGDLDVLEAHVADEIGSIARGIARDFWRRVAADGRISSEFCSYLARGNPVDRGVDDQQPQMTLL